jgi:hypothetical protein
MNSSARTAAIAAPLLRIRPRLMGAPLSGAAQIVIAGLEQLHHGVWIFCDRGQNETLFRQITMVPSAEVFHASGWNLTLGARV